ncbi:MAG: hypothetical protein EOP35_11595 [Rubrivivax sp.]|nr:MAG: hypothetical protein EOP35_11595 [Rubrivivax sp.]
MKTKHTALVAILIACGTLPHLALAQSMPEFKFSGFGTISAVHSNDRTSDFIGTLFQPNGAGHTSSTSLNPDTKLGGQVNAVFGDKLSAVLQVVTQHQYDNSYKPQVEWANIKYQLSPELSVRAGRIAAPSYLLSESRFVGYSYTWARPPVEAYGVLSITSNDGVDATWRSQVAGANNTLQGFVGKSSVKLAGGSTVKSKPSWGINDSVEIGSLTLRAGYNAFKLDLGVASVQPLLATATKLGLAAIADKYKLNGMNLSAVSLGATYDPGDWFATAELVDLKGTGFLSDARAWYASAGYRIGTLTPYATYSTTKAGINAETGAGPLNAAITSTLYAFNATQKTSSLGLRWDAMKSVALKAQYDHVTTGDLSNGRMRAYTGFVKGKGVNLVTLAADFVF